MNGNEILAEIKHAGKKESAPAELESGKQIKQHRRMNKTKRRKKEREKKNEMHHH